MLPGRSDTPASRTNGKGAASAVPSTPEEAEQLLREATTPEQARRIYLLCDEQEEDWRAVKLKADRRWGELLGPAEVQKVKPGPGRGKRVRSSHTFSDSTRDARRRARLVAAVPQEQFDEYLRTTAKPTREGLLRKCGPNQESSKSKPKPTFAGKRRHQVKMGRTEAKRNGRPLAFWEIAWDASRLVYALAGWKVEDVDLAEDNVETMLETEEDLLYLYDWLDDTIALIHSRLGEDKLRKQIGKLRAKTVANGCTSEEEEAAARAADRLQRKVDNQLTAAA